MINGIAMDLLNQVNTKVFTVDTLTVECGCIQNIYDLNHIRSILGIDNISSDGINTMSRQLNYGHMYK